MKSFGSHGSADLWRAPGYRNTTRVEGGLEREAGSVDMGSFLIALTWLVLLGGMALSSCS